MTRSRKDADLWAAAERIASQDLNNLYLTSSFFVDSKRYLAFCALYAVMRVVDDRIDAIPSRRKLNSGSREREHAVVVAWQEAMAAAHGTRRDVSLEDVASPEGVARCENPEAGELISAAAEAMRVFPVPFILWDNFFTAMHQDIDSERFAAYTDFLHYTEGASVAPTTIYLYLITARSAQSGEPYRVPENFDLIACGRALGTFAYLGHILRDLTQDLATGERGLLYLAADDMTAHGVSEAMLHADAARGQASDQVVALVRTLVERSWAGQREGRELLRPLAGRLEPDCAFIIELIITIYERVLEKITACDFDPMRGAHRLTMREKKNIIHDTASRVGYRPPTLKTLKLGARALRARSKT